MEEEERLYNFLKHYSLEQYHESFVKLGVVKIAHLKDVDDEDLTNIGMQRPEKIRLKKKVEENFSTMGKFKKKLSGKDHKFDQTTPTGVKHVVQNPIQKESSKGPVLINPENIKLGKKLGEGAHGTIHEAKLVKENGLVSVAVKTIYTQEKGPSIERLFIKEAQSMAQLDHKHIIKLFGIVLGHQLMLVEELAPFGDLLTYLKSKPVHPGMMHIYAVQLADAMKYLESNNIIHRDLAARNVLLINEKHAMLSDFGLARRIKDGSIYQASAEIPLPTSWLSPEALSEGQFSSASDVWSFGILLWEITSLGGRPWEGIKPVEIYRKLEFGERLPRPKFCYPKLYEVMKLCWTKSPKNRPKFSEIYNMLTKHQYSPDIVKVVENHISEEGVQIKEKDHLYVIDSLGGSKWLGMTTEATIVHFDEAFVTFVPSETQRLTESNDNLGRYQICKKLSSPDHTNVMSTIYDDDPYITMNPAAMNIQTQASSTSLIDSESHSCAVLPTPITPTTETADFVPPTEPPHKLFDPLCNESSNVTGQYSYLSEVNLSKDEHFFPVKDLDSSSTIYVQIPDDDMPSKQESPPPIPPRLSTNSAPPRIPYSTQLVDSSADNLEKLQQEFPNMNVKFLQKALFACQGNIELSIEKVKVDQLLGFGLQYINEEDCRKALKHCQGKVDRAGAWLLEQNETISNRKKLAS